MVTVSVITPVYNAEHTIQETVESVLAQTFTDFEFIIINDGSTDATLKIIDQFSDPRLQVFTFDNSGPQKSRNRGIDKAAGQYISFIDADDLWTPDKLELQLKTLQQNPAASVVYSWTNVIDEKGDLHRRGGHRTKKGDVFIDLLLNNFVESGSNLLAYTEAVRHIGGFDENMVAGQDLDILLSLSVQYAFDAVPKVQVLYRKSQQTKSWSSSIKRARAGIDQVLAKHLLDRKDLKEYRKACIGNSYKYLVFECLSNSPSREKGWYSIRLLWIVILNDRSLLTKKVLLKICLRIMATTLLPHSVSRWLASKYSYFFDITSLYGYLETKRI
ncbi:MAG: glycosyltransferase family 2 protein [Leptolyngbyaceae cyanobacterium]